MSPEQPEKSANENKPPLAIVHNRRKGDAGSDTIVEDIESQKLEFHTNVTPDQQRENTRGHVTSNLMTTFSACVLFITLTGAFAVLSGHYEAISALKTLTEFVTALILPVITLVLGFYFGSERK